MAAVKAFQKSQGLEPDGIVGPLTSAKLFGVAASAVESGPPALVWREEARRMIGVRETRGPEDNRAIMAWADDLDLNYDGDDVPWCGLFVAHCIASTLPDEILPANPLSARSWSRFGEQCEPMTGAVLTFWRGRPDGWQGHVGFYEGEDDDHYFVLGGNQSDAVNVAKLAKTRLIGARWPRTARLLTGTPVRIAFGGPISEDEA